MGDRNHRWASWIWALCLLVVSPILADLPTEMIKAELANAVERQDRAAMELLLNTEQKFPINAPQVDGTTALHWAVYHDDPELTKRLVTAGADVKAENRYGVTPLSLACTNGNAEIVRLLLKTGANPKATLPGGETALMTAARVGRLGPVKALLEAGADVNAKEHHGQTALMWAAAEGHVEVVNALLLAGAEFRSPLKSGFTPLFFAVREGRTEVALALLKAGADVNEAIRPKKTTGTSPARGTSPLILAVENGHFELALALVKAGADPNDQRSGFTPLHVLSWVRKPNRGDGYDGAPPPKGSGELTSPQFVRELVALGTNVNARLSKRSAGRGQLNRSGATPFLLAADTADVSLMRLLAELGADPLLPNADHCTPLMAAAGVGTLAPGEEAGTEAECLEAVRLALKLGGDVNAVDDNGETAMHGAAYKNFPKLVEFLAEEGAEISVWNRKNKSGWTPLLIAQGYRPGNFRPSTETIAALERVMRAAGVSPPASPTPPGDVRQKYPPDESK